MNFRMDFTMKLPFTKMHGAGNDTSINCFVENISRNPNRVAKVVATATSESVPTASADNASTLQMWDADVHRDGSEGIMCGNASRCVGK
jgi:diaminopimelate epimerase